MTDETTSTTDVERHDGPLDLAELSARMSAGRGPVGFVVSPELWSMLRAFAAGASWSRGDLKLAEFTVSGIPVVKDPAMPPAAIDLVYTAAAWRDRLALLGRILH